MNRKERREKFPKPSVTWEQKSGNALKEAVLKLRDNIDREMIEQVKLEQHLAATYRYGLVQMGRVDGKKESIGVNPIRLCSRLNGRL